MMLMTRACRAALDSGSAEVVMEGELAQDGTSLRLYGYDFADRSCVLTLDAMPSGALRAGGAFVQAFECGLLDYYGHLGGWDFTKETELSVKANVRIGELYECIKLGTFHVVDARSDGFSTRLRCEDRLGYLDVPYREMDESEFPTDLGTVVRDVFSQMAELYGRTCFKSLSRNCRFAGDDFEVRTKPDLGGMTCFEVLDKAMEAVGNFAWMDRAGSGLKLMTYVQPAPRVTITEGFRDGPSFWDFDGGAFFDEGLDTDFLADWSYYYNYPGARKRGTSALELKLQNRLGFDYENGYEADGDSSAVADSLDGGRFASTTAEDVAAWVESEDKPSFDSFMKSSPEDIYPPSDRVRYAAGKLPEGQSWSVRRVTVVDGARVGTLTHEPFFTDVLYLTGPDGHASHWFDSTGEAGSRNMAIPVKANPFALASPIVYGNVIRGAWARHFENLSVEAVTGFGTEPGDFLIVDSDRGTAARTCITSCRHVIGGSSTLTCAVGDYVTNYKEWITAKGWEDD